MDQNSENNYDEYNRNQDAHPENNNQEDENDQDMIKVYEMVDLIPLSRPKKNIARDFSDAVLVAEILKFFTPKLVELHNYPATNNLKAKKENWNTLNRKVFRRLNFQLSPQDIDSVVNFKPGYIESILLKLFNTFIEMGIDVEKALQNSQINNSQQLEDINAQSLPQTLKYQQVEDDIRKLLFEKDEIIEGLKNALIEVETNLKISDDNKKILYDQLDSLKRKIRELGLY